MTDEALISGLPGPVVLASSSATRRELLARIVADFEVVAPRVDEGEAPGAPPERVAVALARAKAREVASRRRDAVVIGADTLVVCDGEVIGKPRDRADAVRILTQLTRHPHAVLTGVCVRGPAGRELRACVSTRIRMRRLTADVIERLADAPGALQAAGAYRLQPDDPRVEAIEGSATNVMGLPLDEVREMLRQLLPGGRSEP